MTFHYDADLDQLAVRLAERASVESEEVAPGFVLDFDAEGRVVGFEVEHASRSMDLEHLDGGDLPLADVVLRRSSTLAA